MQPTFALDSFLLKLRQGTLKTYKKGQIVFAQGEPARALYFIRTGKVKLTVASARGREAVVAILGPHDFLGAGCLLGQHRHISTATAMTKSSVIRLDKTTTLRTLRANPDFCQGFMVHLVGRNLRLEEDLIDQLFNPSEKRLARALLLLANFDKEKAPEAVIGGITQETLAEMIGTTRARVNFFMNKFRKLGLVDYNGGITVHNSLMGFLLHD